MNFKAELLHQVCELCIRFEVMRNCMDCDEEENGVMIVDWDDASFFCSGFQKMLRLICILLGESSKGAFNDTSKDAASP